MFEPISRLLRWKSEELVENFNDIYLEIDRNKAKISLIESSRNKHCQEISKLHQTETNLKDERKCSLNGSGFIKCYDEAAWIQKVNNLP